MASYQAGPPGWGMGKGTKYITQYKQYLAMKFNYTLADCHQYLAHLTYMAKLMALTWHSASADYGIILLDYNSRVSIQINALSMSFFQQTMTKIQEKHMGTSVFLTCKCISVLFPYLLILLYISQYFKSLIRKLENI